MLVHVHARTVVEVVAHVKVVNVVSQIIALFPSRSHADEMFSKLLEKYRQVEFLMKLTRPASGDKIMHNWVGS
jgi:hypothetical protein